MGLFGFGNFDVIGGGTGGGISAEEALRIANNAIDVSLAGGNIKEKLDTKNLL